MSMGVVKRLPLQNPLAQIFIGMQRRHQLRHPIKDADPCGLISNGWLGYPPGAAIWHVTDLHTEIQNDHGTNEENAFQLMMS